VQLHGLPDPLPNFRHLDEADKPLNLLHLVRIKRVLR
jgi:hypothetical protein